jgi:hypothetical protein
MHISSLARRATAVATSVGTALTLMATPAFAGSAIGDIRNQVTNTGRATGTTGQTDLGILVGNFINAALGLLGIVLVVIVIYAGFLWMTAQGNDEKVKQAKKMITNAVIGLVLIFAAYAITTFVVTAIDNATRV